MEPQCKAQGSKRSCRALMSLLSSHKQHVLFLSWACHVPCKHRPYLTCQGYASHGWVGSAWQFGCHASGAAPLLRRASTQSRHVNPATDSACSPSSNSGCFAHGWTAIDALPSSGAASDAWQPNTHTARCGMPRHCFSACSAYPRALHCRGSQRNTCIDLTGHT